jgi:hypothetical protein
LTPRNTLLRDLIEIPEAVHRSDFVISLADGIDKPKETVESYVVTEQLVGCFDRALGLIDSVVQSRASKGAYLHGSFGSGKSHFMAVLHLLLEGDPHARSKSELGGVVAKYDERLRGRRYLLVPYHMVGAASMEAGVLGGYVDHVRKLHPDAPMPAVFLDDALLESAKRLRQQMGDEQFFANLGGGGGDEGFGDLAAGWDAAAYERAVAQPAGSSERSALVSDLIDSFFSHTRVTAGASGQGYVQFDKGLAAISQHAKSLGYDAVILFLDELILWFASRMADPTFVNREGQKVAKLVEAAAADRPAPIVSFVARQRDLRDFIGQGVPGAERLGFGDILQWWEGRFDVIELSDTNLRAIVEKRLLAPNSEAARRIIDQAFDEVASRAGSAMDTLMTSDADRAAFRRVYPFSPALIETLVAVSGYLQRERTALRLLLQLLVGKRDELTVGDLVPLGDLYDVIRSGEEPFSDELKRHFIRARDIYQHTLRPMLLTEYGLEEENLSSLADRHAFRTDDRLIKTLLLAALVPHVEPLRGLTVRRLADLNHGTIRTPVPGAERAAVLGRLRKWAPDVPEMRLEGDEHDPSVSLQLTGVDVGSILDQAAGVDNVGARRAKVRALVADSLGVELGGGFTPDPYTWIWRGSRRSVDVRFANVRDATDIPDSEFRALGNPRVIIDFPFDERDFGPADDLVRMDELRRGSDPSPTLAWLPLFLSEAALERLGRLVVLDHILAGDRFDGYTRHLSPQDRVEARHLLQNQADSLRGQMRDVLRQAYGLQTPDERWVVTDIAPRDQFPTLDPTLTVRPPTAATMKDAFEQLLDQLLSHLYPAHPEFEDEVRPGDLRTALKYIEQAVGRRDQRVDDIPRSDRKAVRKVLGPLHIAITGEAHIKLDRHWRDHFHRKQAEHPGVTVTVERLKQWMDEPRRMGLEDRVANLVVSSYVLADDRILVHAGQTLEPTVDSLPAATEVRRQDPPPEEQWDKARPLAEAVFGVQASPIRNVANASRLADAIKAVASEHVEACRALVDALAEAFRKVGADEETDRMRTARAGRDLVESVRRADDMDAVRVLAETRVPTSSQALGVSIKSARRVTEALQRTNWKIINSVADLSGEWGTQGAALRQRVVDALQRDEHAQRIADILEGEERAATDLLTRAAQGGRGQPITEPPRPPTGGPGGRTGSDGRLPKRGEKRGLAGDEARVVLEELQRRSGELQELHVTWTFRD